MRICHIVPHFGHGGDLTVVKATICLLTELNHELTINNLNLNEYNSGAENPFPLSEGFAGIIKSLRHFSEIPSSTEVIHAHSPICLAFALWIRKFHLPSSAVVFTFHWPVADAGFRRTLKARLMRGADRVHVVSTETQEDLLKRYSLKPSQLGLIPLGVPSNRFIRTPQSLNRVELRRYLGLPPEARILGYLGRLATEKQVDFPIKFLHEHHKQFPDLHLAIAGSGDLEAILRSKAMEGPAANRIHFLGYTSEPENVYPAFDLLILPSTFEAFPLVVVEAAYCGVPTLRSDAEGSRDQIRHNVNGFLFSRTDGYQAMRDELYRILETQWDSLPKIGEAACRHLVKLCDPEAFCRSLANFYEQAIKKRQELYSR